MEGIATDIILSLETISFKSFVEEYQNEILNLIKCLKNNPNDAINIILAFSEKYFVTLNLWLMISRNVENSNMDLHEKKNWCKVIDQKAAYHYCFYNYINREKLIFYNPPPSPGEWNYPVALMKDFPFAQQELSFPHIDLISRFDVYHEYSSFPIRSEIISNYEKNKKILNKIFKAFETNFDPDWELKFFQSIYEVNDKEFIMQNVEYLLESDNKEMWKLYIEYLRNIDPLAMLQVYSRYVRLFLDDNEMLKKYSEETEKYGFPVIKCLWKNPFWFEKIQTSATTSENFEIEKVVDKHMFIKTFFQNRKIQNLPFQRSLMNYILKNVKPLILQKFYQTCKHFFSSLNIPICHRLVLGFFENEDGPRIEFIDFDQNSMHISKKFPENFLTCKLHITNSLQVCILPNPLQFSKFIPLIDQSYIRFFDVQKQIFTHKEYSHLVKAGNVEKLRFFKVKIIKDDNDFAVLEDVIEKMSKVKDFRWYTSADDPQEMCTKKTAKFLNNFNFVNKIQRFDFQSNDLLEPLEFCEFLEKRRPSKVSVFNQALKTFIEEFFINVDPNNPYYMRIE